MAAPLDDIIVIYRPYYTLKNGKRIFASQYGLKAFPIKVKVKKLE